MRVHVRAHVHTHFGQGLYARTVQVILGIMNYVKFGFPKILFNFPFSFIEFNRHLLLCLSDIHCPFLYSPVHSLGTPPSAMSALCSSPTQRWPWRLARECASAPHQSDESRRRGFC